MHTENPWATGALREYAIAAINSAYAVLNSTKKRETFPYPHLNVKSKGIVMLSKGGWDVKFATASGRDPFLEPSEVEI